MNRTELDFQLPAHLAATTPPETRGIPRDQVRMLVSNHGKDIHSTFDKLSNFLNPGDLVVVNKSAAIRASLSASGRLGNILLNLSTSYGGGLWVAEPRWSAAAPGPLPLKPGDVLQIGDQVARMVRPFPGIPRLWFIQIDFTPESIPNLPARPIRYGYTEVDFPLEAYQTLFSTVPGSAEMPSAARPFSDQVLDSLSKKGVEVISVLLHTGVSSLEVTDMHVENHTLYPEPYEVPAAAAEAINGALERGVRIVAVGTTVVRAVESAWDGSMVRSSKGFTRLFIHPGRSVKVVSGLLTGFHDPGTSHLAMLMAMAGPRLVRRAYQQAVEHGYLWHEFGDSHLILPRRPARPSQRNSRPIS